MDTLLTRLIMSAFQEVGLLHYKMLGHRGVSDVVLKAIASPQGSLRQNFCCLVFASVLSFLPRALPRPRTNCLVYITDRGADITSDHYLVIAHVKLKL